MRDSVSPDRLIRTCRVSSAVGESGESEEGTGRSTMAMNRQSKGRERFYVKETGRKFYFLPVDHETNDYWSAVKASHSTSVPGSAPPVGSKRTTPDSSEQNVR
jgi:hypothetical protein